MGRERAVESGNPIFSRHHPPLQIARVLFSLGLVYFREVPNIWHPWLLRHGSHLGKLFIFAGYKTTKIWNRNRKRQLLIKSRRVAPFTWENRKFPLESHMFRTIPFGRLQKIWVVICGDAIFSTLFTLFSWFGQPRLEGFSLKKCFLGKIPGDEVVIWAYVVAGRSTATPIFLVLPLRIRFPPECRVHIRNCNHFSRTFQGPN